MPLANGIIRTCQSHVVVYPGRLKCLQQYSIPHHVHFAIDGEARGPTREKSRTLQQKSGRNQWKSGKKSRIEIKTSINIKLG